MSVICEVKEAVAYVTIDRAEKHNAFDEEVIAGITQIFKDISRDNEVRLVVLRGKGKSFCAGGDLAWMKRAAAYNISENMQDAGKLSGMLRAVDKCTKPVIAIVQGAIYGGGVGLSACADVVLAVEDSRFSLSEVRLGLIPAVISPYVISKIGVGAARRYFLTAEVFDAKKAMEIGLVHEVFSADIIEEELEKLSKEILKGGPNAQAATKRLIANCEYQAAEDIALKTCEAIVNARAGLEGHEGISAFLEKRKPKWRVQKSEE